MEPANKGRFRDNILYSGEVSFVRRLSSLGGLKCIGTIGRNHLGHQVVSFVERSMYIVLIWESPLSDVTLSLHYLTLQVCVLEHPKVQRSEEERGKDSEEGVDSGLLPEEAEAANKLVRHARGFSLHVQ